MTVTKDNVQSSVSQIKKDARLGGDEMPGTLYDR